MDIERLHSLGKDLARIVAELSQPALSHEIDDSQDMPAGKIRDVLRSRRLRERMLPEGLFADPALDMLLELSVCQADGLTMSITELCSSVQIALTTGLRWIVELESHDLIERAPDPTDRRKAQLRLTAAGQNAMSRYFAALKQAGLPVA